MTNTSPTPEPAGAASFKGIKIRCKNRYWARAAQITLRDTIKAQWGGVVGSNIPIPSSTFRLWLVVQLGVDGGWYISWCPEREFDAVPLPEWDAQQLVLAAPKQV